MHRSSDTIATIAAALAKAQVELTNPEKSLVATIRSPFPREGDRTFRYAPLSSGLDIIRKSLGRHEIATIQATNLDKEAGLLRLTTILAHSSGEWISSDWPVCQITDIASAQRVGAALTYARRYALFTLVGIAGEDDLDAPDLGADPTPTAELPWPGRPPNGQTAAARPRANSDRRRPEAAAKSVLGEQLSASLRESLIEQMAAINSADEAAAWAYRNMPAKNTLTAADAQIVEERFRARLSVIGAPEHRVTHELPHAVPDQILTSVGLEARGRQNAPTRAKNQSHSEAIRSLGKPVRLRNKDHRRFVLRQACLVCGRVPSDPHHLTFTQPRALGRRVSDEFTVPICRLHHRELRHGGADSTLIRFLSRSSSGSKRGRTIKHQRRLIHKLSPSRRRKVRLLIELRKRPFKLPADMLEEMTLCEEVFHSPSGIAFADFITDGHRETWPIRSKRFRTWVRRCYYQATGAAPGGAVIVSALDLLEARAQFDAPGPRG